MAETQRSSGGERVTADHERLLRRQSTFVREPSLSSPSLDESKSAALAAFRPQLRDKFNVGRVEEVLREIIQEFMKGRTYSAEEAMDWSSNLSSLVNDRVKLFKFSRYKIVCLITIGENIGGGMLSGMKTQWDNSTDAFATYTYITDSLFVIGTVFGVYFY